MRCSLKEILQRIDLRGYEAATEQRCPVCGTESVLSIRGSQSIACRKCAFVGDIIHLYAAAKRIDLLTALAELKYPGLLEFNDDIEESIYRSDAELQARLQRVVALGRDKFAGETSTPRTILGDHRCWYTMETTVKGSRYHGFLQRRNFDEADIDFPKDAAEALRWWGNYGAVTTAVYQGWKIVGFWLIRLHAEEDVGATPCEFYLPIITTEGDGVGYAHAIPIGTPEVFLTHSALVAMRYNMRQLFDGDIETPFVVPGPGGRINTDCLGESQPIFFTATLDPAWFYRATTVTSALSVFYTDYVDLGFVPTVSLTRKQAGAAMSRTVVSYLRNRARPSHEAYARFLLSKKPQEAKRISEAYPMSPIGQSRCFQACSGEDAVGLARIFERGTRTRLVDIDGKTVMERDEGWFCGDLMITDTTFQINEICVDGATTVARGSVRFRRVGIPFECPYELIRKNTRSWLEDIVMTQPGQGLPMMNPAWGSKLLRIATALQEPRRVVKGTSHGWGDSGKALFMPYFTIRPDGIMGTEHAIPGGPMLPRPAPLTAEEWSVVQDPHACQIFLALLTNLLRTQAGLPGYGIAVRSSPHVVETVAAALRTPVVRDPRPDLLNRAALNPTPMPVIWTDDGLAEAFNAGIPMHVLMSVDPGSHRLLKLQKNWLCIESTDYSWGDAIRFIFLVIKDLLWAPGADVIKLDAEHVFTDIAKRLHAGLADRGIAGDCFLEAARELGKTVNHQGNAGFTLLMTLEWAHEKGLVTPVLRDGLQIFQVAEIRAALANPLTPRADIELLARQLTQARFLALNRAGEWGIVASVWDSAVSLYASK